MFVHSAHKFKLQVHTHTHTTKTHHLVTAEAHRYAYRSIVYSCWQVRHRLEICTDLGIKLRELGRKLQGLST